MAPRPRRKFIPVYSGRGFGQTVPRAFIPVKSSMARKQGHRIVEVNGKFFLVPFSFYGSSKSSNSSSRSRSSRSRNR